MKLGARKSPSHHSHLQAWKARAEAAEKELEELRSECKGGPRPRFRGLRNGNTGNGLKKNRKQNLKIEINLYILCVRSFQVLKIAWLGGLVTSNLFLLGQLNELERLYEELTSVKCQFSLINASMYLNMN